MSNPTVTFSPPDPGGVRKVYVNGKATVYRLEGRAVWAKCLYKWHVYADGWGSHCSACADTLSGVKRKVADGIARQMA